MRIQFSFFQIFLLVFCFVDLCFSMHQDKRQCIEKREAVVCFNPKPLTVICSQPIYDQYYANNQDLDLEFIKQSLPRIAYHIAKHTNQKGDSLLHVCSYLGRLDDVKYLHQLGLDLRVRNKKGELPIHHASYAGHFKVVEYLYDSGGYGENSDFKEILIGLMSMKEEAAVTFFEKHGYFYDCTLVHYAAQGGGHIGFLKILLDKKGSALQYIDGLTQKYWEGRTPVHLAAKNGHAQHLKLLLEKGFPLNTADEEGYSPAYYAASNGHISCLETLSSCGASWENVDDTRNSNGAIDKGTMSANPLHGAVCNNQKEVVRWLIDHGADVNAGDWNNYEPLLLAVKDGNIAMVQLLLAHKATTEGLQFLLLDGALSQEKFDMAQFLLDQKICTVNENDEAFTSPRSLLSEVVESNDAQSVAWLLARGADVNHASVQPDKHTSKKIIELIENAKKLQKN